jgi:hypothetical protein
MRVKVSLTGDLCFPRPGCLTLHDGSWLPPAPYPPGMPVPCFEAPTPMRWDAGFALRQNKLTKTVSHKAQLMVLDGHDCGAMIPHLMIPPLNLKLGIIMLFSSRKVMFAASTVKANGDSIGCTDMSSSPVPLPMQCCAWPIPLPNGFPAFNSLNTVSVGLGLGDIVAGFIAIAAEIVGSSLAKHLRLEAGRLTGLAARLLGASSVEEWALKAALGGLAGCARIALTQEGKLKVEVGSAYVGAEASVEYRRDGHFALKAQGNALSLERGISSMDGQPNVTSIPPPSHAPPVSWGLPL